MDKKTYLRGIAIHVEEEGPEDRGRWGTTGKEATSH